MFDVVKAITDAYMILGKVDMENREKNVMSEDYVPLFTRARNSGFFSGEMGIEEFGIFVLFALYSAHALLFGVRRKEVSSFYLFFTVLYRGIEHYVEKLKDQASSHGLFFGSFPKRLEFLERSGTTRLLIAAGCAVPLILIASRFHMLLSAVAAFALVRFVQGFFKIPPLGVAMTAIIILIAFMFVNRLVKAIVNIFWSIVFALDGAILSLVTLYIGFGIPDNVLELRKHLLRLSFTFFRSNVYCFGTWVLLSIIGLFMQLGWSLKCNSKLYS